MGMTFVPREKREREGGALYGQNKLHINKGKERKKEKRGPIPRQKKKKKTRILYDECKKDAHNT